MKHSPEFLQLVNEVKDQVKEISVEQAQLQQHKGALLVDVREDNEWEAGHATNAIHLGRGIIERDIIDKIPNKNTELILYCGGGFRSLLSAYNLQKMGYTHVYSMAGGWRSWKDEGAPVEV
ncbi:MAG TPA: rhodanese-like domain-containing protein [Flavisolibacter sp.]|nr:rhodanese-like domain-containing protein [Flavisolibacter sp.]